MVVFCCDSVNCHKMSQDQLLVLLHIRVCCLIILKCIIFYGLGEKPGFLYRPNSIGR